MLNKCPGQQNKRDLDSVLVPCPDCGRLVEFFTDEPKRTCRCGHTMLREALPKCADWCPAAAECLGEAVDIRQLQDRLARVRNDPRAKACLADIQARIRKAASDRDQQ